tara:strand:- start:2589 stop:2795 length:207 start_codon:yes stop_codon:yes gene_type:complete
MTSVSLPALCTVKRTAKELFDDDSQSAKNRIYVWIETGELKANKVGNRYYIPRREIERYLNPTNEAQI